MTLMPEINLNDWKWVLQNFVNTCCVTFVWNLEEWVLKFISQKLLLSSNFSEPKLLKPTSLQFEPKKSTLCWIMWVVTLRVNQVDFSCAWKRMKHVPKPCVSQQAPSRYTDIQGILRQLRIAHVPVESANPFCRNFVQSIVVRLCWCLCCFLLLYQRSQYL